MSLINKEPSVKIMDLSSKVVGIYGRAGIGKSTLASCFEGVYFCATEAGLSHMEGIHKTNVTYYTRFLALGGEFAKGYHEFKT